MSSVPGADLALQEERADSNSPEEKAWFIGSVSSGSRIGSTETGGMSELTDSSCSSLLTGNKRNHVRESYVPFKHMG